ncbi:MAG TPA: hypothetical protein VF704_12590 [Allosphingosinicella sp.]
MSKIQIFFSCSFDEPDEHVAGFFLGICKGLDLEPTNVSTASALTPPDVAKRKISSSEGLVAICTRRAELKDGGFIMPQAVHDEISFAYGKDIPVLMFVERGVSLLGFKSNFGTYLEFSRDDLFNPGFVERATKALYDLRDFIAGSIKSEIEQGVSDAYAEHLYHLVELRHANGDFLWTYHTTKKLVYTQVSRRAFSSGVWASLPPNVPEESADARWSMELLDSSRGITLEKTVQTESPTVIQVFLRPNPPAEPGDFIEYSIVASSRYINPVWEDEVIAGAEIHLDDGDYACADGLLFVHRTRRGIIEWRFPRESGLLKRDLVPFVGSHTRGIDYEVKSELERATLRVDEFGGNLSVRMEVESPLPGHMYGVAWNPKPRP